MYKNFFGFNERPFKLVPDPAYLFLSKTHEKALAHLTYAVIQGEGFVEITGEVGTGKTTLCRAFLENLDETTQAAYIFNPKLNSIQLLKAINDEFGIRSDADTSKDLIDTLNVFLIEEKAKGKNVILIIDEAQNLSNEVLEQLRLLSNLETTRHKLLQIILVGQPELSETLDSRELRQLGQRIALSCQLIPLSFKELIEYIHHRISIASRYPGVTFTRSAYQLIYKYSRGIPRLINIVADRSLLIAYTLEKDKITGRMVKTAIRELAGRGDVKRYTPLMRKRAIVFSSLLCLTLLIGILYRPGILNVISRFNLPAINKQNTLNEEKDPEPVSIINQVLSKDAMEVKNPKPVQTENLEPIQTAGPELTAIKDPEPSVKPLETITPDSAVDLQPSLVDFMGTTNSTSSRRTALKAAIALWNKESEIKTYLDGIENDHDFFRIAAKQNGFMIRRIQGSISLIKRIDLPAILELYPLKESSPVYLTISKMNNDKITLRGGNQGNSVKVDPGDLNTHWSGIAYFLWKDFLSLTGTIPITSSKDSVITLKMLLKDIGFKEIEISQFYDERTKEAVRKIQQKYGINVDGVVGSTTKIVLYNEKNYKDLPHIAE
jgi:general secretion pathway protein A